MDRHLESYEEQAIERQVPVLLSDGSNTEECGVAGRADRRQEARLVGSGARLACLPRPLSVSSSALNSSISRSFRRGHHLKIKVAEVETKSHAHMVCGTQP